MNSHQAQPPNSQLGAIVGHWKTSGHVIAEPPIPVLGTDKYEWLPGEHFLVHYVDVHVGDQHVQAIEIIGELVEDGDFLVRSYDSYGNVETLRLKIDKEGIFHFSGGAEIAPASRTGDIPAKGKVRSTLTIANDRRSMDALWERADDGKTWEP
jgi:hypothetical protein